MARPRNPSDPTDERTQDIREIRTEDDDLVARNGEERHETPRRYEQDAVEDTVLPSNDSTLNTKI